MSQQDRSTRITQVSPEVFTAEDYLEARMMEDFLDSLALREALPVDRPDEKLVEKAERAVDALGIPQSADTEKAFVGLVRKISDVSQAVASHAHNPIGDIETDYLGEGARERYNLKPFSQQLRYITSRYLVEFIESKGQYHEVTEDSWLAAITSAEDIMDDLPELVQTIYDVDIPAYTVLFGEFDRIRTDRGYPVEVYLGRDGIYAYYGRLAEYAARGDNDPVSNQYPADEAQIILRPNPKYIVYSRGVMSSADEDTKKRYVTQFFDPDQEIHFYDTGYHGSIPQDIMTILGFNPQEIDQRIHLLDATAEARQLKGLARPINIEVIENHPKDEHPASGLVEDESGIRYSSSPTQLAEQFKFLVVRDVLLRHFWTKEYEEIEQHLSERAVDTSLQK